MINSFAAAIGSSKRIAPDVRTFQSNTRAVTYTDGSVYSDERNASLVTLITERDSLTIDHAFDLGVSLADTARDLVEDLASEWICNSGDDMFAAHASDVRRAAALHVRCEITDAIHGLHYAMAAGPFVVEVFGFATPL